MNSIFAIWIVLVSCHPSSGRPDNASLYPHGRMSPDRDAAYGKRPDPGQADRPEVQTDTVLHLTRVYDSLLAIAENAYDSGFYSDALLLYDQLLDYYPGDSLALGRIETIKTLRKKRMKIWILPVLDFERSTAFVLFLYVVIIYSILTMLILLVVILLNRNRMVRRTRQEEDLKEKYQGILMNYLFDKELGQTVPRRLIKIASSGFKRRILIDQMIDLSINLKGDVAGRMRMLYRNAGLHHDSILRAHSRKWHQKIKAFRELAFMDIHDANDEIKRCLHSHNDILRMEAQIALVKLGEGNPYAFLDLLERPFSLWEQMNVHEMIIQHEIDPPGFAYWLHSPNLSVVIFALRMIRIFKQEEGYPEIIPLLDHPDEMVRRTAIEVLGEIGYQEATVPLKKMYKKEDYENCLAIVRALGKIHNDTVLNFLQLVIDSEEDVQLQIEAAKAIENMGDKGRQALEKMMATDYKNYQIIIKHVLDKRIF